MGSRFSLLPHWLEKYFFHSIPTGNDSATWIPGEDPTVQRGVSLTGALIGCGRWKQGKGCGRRASTLSPTGGCLRRRSHVGGALDPAFGGRSFPRGEAVVSLEVRLHLSGRVWQPASSDTRYTGQCICLLLPSSGSYPVYLWVGRCDCVSVDHQDLIRPAHFPLSAWDHQTLPTCWGDLSRPTLSHESYTEKEH